MPAKFLLNSKKGYLLIESFIAISVIIVGLLGIFSLLSQSLGLYRVISDQYAATALASEGLEIVKNIIDNNTLAGQWDRGIAAGNYQIESTSETLGEACGTACVKSFFFDPQTNAYNFVQTGQPTRFIRVIGIEQIVDREGLVQALRVNSKVSWTTRGSGQFNINLEDIFYNYR